MCVRCYAYDLLLNALGYITFWYVIRANGARFHALHQQRQSYTLPFQPQLHKQFNPLDCVLCADGTAD